ncbi:MAG: acetate--CoA ligase family protein [Proteobacteria bacterium]|nr:acetate--CoA ligase family protein [Pseudomonadota bacterium]
MKMNKSALDALLTPRSAAIVGASPRPSVGGRMFRNMIRCGFAGTLFPVNPGYTEIDGTACYPDMESLPAVPDCVVIAVPYANVFEPLEAAARRGVKAAVIVAEGFADAATDEGRARQARLAGIARDYGMVLSGPNSMGLIGLKAGLGAAFTTLPEGLATGGVSLVSQSGGLLNATIELGHNRTIGFNYLLSGGNEAVVTSADYIDWLADDPGTSVIMNILEGARDGRRYRAAIARAVRKKPVVLLKLGRTDAGRAAALAHTGSLAGDNAAYEALAREAPIALVRTIDEMIETAKLFDRMKRPSGDRVFLFSVSGGATVLAGDLARDAGINLPPMGDATNSALQEILEIDHPFQNPMDVVGAPRLAKGDNLTRCLAVLLADDDFDAIAFVMVAQRSITDSHQIMHDQYEAVMARAPKSPGKPIVMISEMNWQPAERPAIDAPYIAGTLDHGLRALKRLIDFAAYQNNAESLGESATLLTPLALRIAGDTPLGEADSTAILEANGLPFARHALAANAGDAVEKAAEIGFPVALKIASPHIAHKTELDGIRLNLTDKAAVRSAHDDLLDTVSTKMPEARIDGVLVQEMVAGGVEMILGMVLDPQFGPLMMVGAGGTLTELIEDRAVGFAPLAHAQAAAMIDSLRIARLLDGWRGGVKLDRGALADALVTLSQFAARTDGQIAAIDLNPVMVLPEGQGVRIVDALIVPNSQGA